MRLNARYASLYGAFEEHRKRQLGGRDSRFVFVADARAAAAGVPMSPSTLHKRLRAIAQAIGCPHLQLTLLRNSIAGAAAAMYGAKAAVAAGAVAAGRSKAFMSRQLTSTELTPAFLIAPPSDESACHGQSAA